MALTPNFSATQQIGIPNAPYLVDTSTGSDGSIASRRVTITKADGTTLVPVGTSTSYTVWPIANSFISIACLSSDTAPFVKVDWVDAGGTVLYTKTILCDFSLYNTQASFELTKDLTSAPNTLMDNDYWLNRMKLRCNIDDALQAVSIGGNIYIAQAALDRASYLVTNKSKFF